MHSYVPSRLSAFLSIAACAVGAALVFPACEGDSTPSEEVDAACNSGDCTPVCRIDGATTGPGTVNPANACTHCDPALADNQWSPRSNGTACAPGRVCVAGRCEAQCFIDGALVASGAGKPDDACQKCDAAISTAAWTPRAIGETCGSGMICESGACNAKCFIGGTFYAANAVNPANACEQCIPGTSTAAWTPRAEIPLLTGGTDVATQGWSVARSAPSTLAYGTDYVSVTTSTVSGTRSGGHLLLYYPAAYTVGAAFKFRVVMLVESVASHNQFDSAAAILGAFTPAFGDSVERSQMLYLDSAAIGWTDDNRSTPPSPFTVTDGAYHTYEFSLDTAGVARVSVDGAPKLTRNGFVGNGIIAVGDQTNDANVDSTLRIRSVSRVCP